MYDFITENKMIIFWVLKSRIQVPNDGQYDWNM
jgi:hypothetical protein